MPGVQIPPLGPRKAPILTKWVLFCNFFVMFMFCGVQNWCILCDFFSILHKFMFRLSPVVTYPWGILCQLFGWGNLRKILHSLKRVKEPRFNYQGSFYRLRYFHDIRSLISCLLTSTFKTQDYCCSALFCSISAGRFSTLRIALLNISSTLPLPVALAV